MTLSLSSPVKKSLCSLQPFTASLASSLLSFQQRPRALKSEEGQKSGSKDHLRSVFDVTKGRSHYGRGGGYNHFAGSSVFDVTKGRSHYGPGGGYNHFAGRDASRAFVTGNFTGDGLTDSLHGFSSTEMKSVVDWRDFYHRSYTEQIFSHEMNVLSDFANSVATILIEVAKDIMLSFMYGHCQENDCGDFARKMQKANRFVGKLVGRYYDSQGKPTKSLKGVEAKAARGAQLLEKQKIEEAKLPNCNSRWSQHEGGEVWCDIGYPRLVQRPLEIALSGKMSRRCACFKEEELGQGGLEVYKGCDYLAKTCPV
ncbi:hypothetical protein HHK36_014251 [Tetracentron sinense]|uniref:Cytochrome b5 heme-binding domain-containing protein n=1 Tax=Tetracentron sinense TaxID=13715 RepID=A0A835DF00_TETSI|nr:hypothetical protein HHK36_014251 [Tetracentron sinense]